MQITLFFTYGVGLTTWEKRGIFSREVGYYKALVLAGIDRVVFVTYDPQDAVYRAQLEESGIYLCIRPKLVPRLVYSFISPLLFWREMKMTTIFKTNQMSGSWSGVLARLIWRKLLVVRTGYTWSYTKKRQGNIFYFFIAKIIENLSGFFADAIVITTANQLSLLSKKNHHKTSVIPNYIDTLLFSPHPNKDSGDKKEFHIITVGRFAPEKNLEFLLHVLAKLPFSSVLHLVGDGELRGAISMCANKLGVSVVFEGIVPNNILPNILCEADIFVLPSIFEGNPKAILEAMSCGLPVVAGDTSGILDIIQHDVTGYISKLNISDFVSSLQYVYTNIQKAKKVGDTARKWVIDNQSLDIVINKEFNLYKTLLFRI